MSFEQDIPLGDPAAYTTTILDNLYPPASRHWVMSKGLNGIVAASQYLTPLITSMFASWRYAALFFVLCYFIWTTSTPAWVAHLRKRIVDSIRLLVLGWIMMLIILWPSEWTPIMLLQGAEVVSSDESNEMRSWATWVGISSVAIVELCWIILALLWGCPAGASPAPTPEVKNQVMAPTIRNLDGQDPQVEVQVVQTSDRFHVDVTKLEASLEGDLDASLSSGRQFDNHQTRSTPFHNTTNSRNDNKHAYAAEAMPPMCFAKPN